MVHSSATNVPFDTSKHAGTEQILPFGRQVQRLRVAWTKLVADITAVMQQGHSLYTINLTHSLEEWTYFWTYDRNQTFDY